MTEVLGATRELTREEAEQLVVEALKVGQVSRVEEEDAWYIVDYDLPATHIRKRFYRAVRRYLLANNVEPYDWSTQSVVFTQDREFALFVYQQASSLGRAHLYKGERMK